MTTAPCTECVKRESRYTMLVTELFTPLEYGTLISAAAALAARVNSPMANDEGAILLREQLGAAIAKLLLGYPPPARERLIQQIALAGHTVAPLACDHQPRLQAVPDPDINQGHV